MRLLRAVVLLVLVVACTLPAVLGAKSLVQVQVMHRHGARAAITTVNESVICGFPQNCGELNAEGKAMLVGLGTYLRQQYGDALQLPLAFNQFKSYTQSTDIDRTIQSADGLLRGLYPNMTDFFPIIHTLDFATDFVLHPTAQPALAIPVAIGKQPSTLPDAFYTNFTAAQLRQMGAEVSLQGLCDKDAFSKPEYEQCALVIQDVAASWRASGRLGAGTMTAQHYPWLAELRRLINVRDYIYVATDKTWKAQGSTGYPLAANIASWMMKQTGVMGAGAKPLQTFFEWSAHDTTYMPLATAIGYNTAEYMLPLFGQAFIFELWYDDAAAAGASGLGQYSVRVSGGAPQQLPPAGGVYTYTVTPYAAQGINATTGATYGASEVPLEDFSRLVNATAPGNAAGYCYLSDDVKKDIHCDTTHAPTDAHCLSWRQLCPDFGCPSGYVVNTDDYSCVAKHPHLAVTQSTAIVLVVVSAAAGLLLGAAIACMIAAVRARREREGEPAYSKVD